MAVTSNPTVTTTIINTIFIFIMSDFPSGSDCLPTMQETWVQSLSWEDLLEKEMATPSSTLAWKIP